MARSPGSSSLNKPTPLPKRALQMITLIRVPCLVLGVVAIIAALGFPHLSWLIAELDRLFLGLAMILSTLPLLEWLVTPSGTDRFRGHRLHVTIVAITLLGWSVLALVVPNRMLAHAVLVGTRTEAIHLWWRLTILVWAGLGLVGLFRRISVAGWSPATILVLSFLVVVLVGTLLLMLPFARPTAEGADFWTALFTSTSAVCVTGLTVTDTGTYWSRGGQMVILALIQVGGLGIMTFGGFFSMLLGRGLMVHETVLLGDLLERKVLTEVRRLVVAILVLTLVTEAIGALILTRLWSDLPLEDRVFFSVFHAVSAFCNAGFSLLPASLEGYGARWEVWGGVAGLIIIGGLGFTVLYNLFEVGLSQLKNYFHTRSTLRPHHHATLNVTTRLVVVTTLILLVGGTVGIFILEGPGMLHDKSFEEQLADAWFQSVTTRTAGFNTIPIGEMREATKFLMVLLMFIGASPGSTGGGVKTVSLAVMILTLRSVIRSRHRVEVFRRTIPDTLVYRALLIIAVGATLVVGLTLVTVAIENQPGYFLDYLFEVSSALATVGLSTGVTASLSTASRCVIILAMFMGRVGPLTLLIALAHRAAPERYRYPEERVVLG